nr:phospholipase D-like domain-containing protein [Vulcanococcus sp. Clear-D1]
MSLTGFQSGSSTHCTPQNSSWNWCFHNLHHKLAVIDGNTVITGSFNWSPSAAHQNDEVLMVIHSPLLAAHFTREIDRLWKGADLGINAALERKLLENRRRCGSGMQRL